jgi:hypothetical protein
MTRPCHFDANPPGMRKRDFQLPQAVLTLFGNRKISKRTMLRVIRCLKAGDLCASQARMLCLTRPLAIRDRWQAKVLLYAIELGHASASVRASRYYSAIPFGKRDFVKWTRLHSASPRQCQKPLNSTRRSSPGRESKKERRPADSIFFSKLKYARFPRSHSI